MTDAEVITWMAGDKLDTCSMRSGSRSMQLDIRQWRMCDLTSGSTGAPKVAQRRIEVWLTALRRKKELDRSLKMTSSVSRLPAGL